MPEGYNIWDESFEDAFERNGVLIHDTKSFPYILRFDSYKLGTS